MSAAPARIAEHSIDRVLEATDLVAVVDQYVKLRRVGPEFVGLCPFHQERTPSFYVNPSKRVWMCRGGCAVGGNVVGFLERIEGWKFPEVIRHLSERFSIPLDKSEITQKQQRRAEEMTAESEEFWGTLYRTWTEILVDSYVCLRQARAWLKANPNDETEKAKLARLSVEVLPEAAQELERRLLAIEEASTGMKVLGYREESQRRPLLGVAVRDALGRKRKP